MAIEYKLYNIIILYYILCSLKKRDYANNSNILDYHSTTDYHSSIEDILRKQKEGNRFYFTCLGEFIDETFS